MRHSQRQSYVDPAVTTSCCNNCQRPDQANHELSAQIDEREVEVLRLIGRGLSNADIAHHLHLAEGTVRNHVSSIN